MSNTAVDCIRHSLNQFEIPTEANLTDHSSLFVLIEHHRICIGGYAPV